ncbi:MAG: hypothetical protein ACRD8O_21585 [Bryobacteraceae bacterium]
MVVQRARGADPTQPQTAGDHIRRRLTLKMLQREVSEQLGADETCIYNWERNAAEPEIRYKPWIIEFLGYNPLPEAKTPGEQLVRQRTTLGYRRRKWRSDSTSIRVHWRGGSGERGSRLARHSGG